MPTVSQLEALLAGACSPEETLALLAHLKPHLATQALVTTLWQLLWQQRSPAYANLPALPHVLDTCGTGGSPLGSFNTSTCVAIVLASAGVAVVKFGNRSATGRSGSTDFLEAIGLPPEAMHQHHSVNDRRPFWIQGTGWAGIALKHLIIEGRFLALLFRAGE